MSSAITNVLPIQRAAGQADSGKTAAAQPSVASTRQTSTAADVVQISEAQRVYQLYNQGQTIQQIALGLNLSVAAVNEYLSAA